MRTVHEYMEDLSEGVSKDEDNFYKSMVENAEDFDEPGFLFGKCIYKDLSTFNPGQIYCSV